MKFNWKLKKKQKRNNFKGKANKQTIKRTNQNKARWDETEKDDQKPKKDGKNKKLQYEIWFQKTTGKMLKTEKKWFTKHCNLAEALWAKQIIEIKVDKQIQIKKLFHKNDIVSLNRIVCNI